MTMINNCLSEPAFCALKKCIAKAGPNKGSLLSRAPSPFKEPEAHAAWNAAMLAINPFKVSIFSMMMNTRMPELQAIADEITAFFDAHPQLKYLDKDRRVLASLGVW